MIARLFHRWERRLASVETNRLVRPFEWGPDWIDAPAPADPREAVAAWSRAAMADTDRFYDTSPCGDYRLDGDVLSFPSAVVTPYPSNNTVIARVFPARPRAGDAGKPRRAIVVLPQWNADAGGHVGLCQLFAYFGITAVRLSLPYHDGRRPP